MERAAGTVSSHARIAGTVLSVDADSALIDFNHPLAGRALHFEVELIGVI